MAAGWATRLDRAASRGTLWAVGSCFHATSALMVEVNVFCDVFNAPLSHHIHSLIVCFCVRPLSEDIDDWDLEVFPKPSEVQNDLYVGNEDEDDEGEDLEGRKVMVRCSQ